MHVPNGSGAIFSHFVALWMKALLFGLEPLLTFPLLHGMLTYPSLLGQVLSSFQLPTHFVFLQRVP